jgi:hypothetical protein
MLDMLLCHLSKVWLYETACHHLRSMETCDSMSTKESVITEHIACINTRLLLIHWMGTGLL